MVKGQGGRGTGSADPQQMFNILGTSHILHCLCRFHPQTPAVCSRHGVWRDKCWWVISFELAVA